MDGGHQNRTGDREALSETGPHWAVVSRLLVSLAIPVLAGGIGGWATARGVVEWYPTLVKPPFNPPAWVFGPVWTLLYILMGVALFLVWSKGFHRSAVRKAVGFFGLHLLLNVFWSYLFFGARAPGWALVEILILWVAIVWTLVLFSRIKRTAGWLLVPYLAWVTFASVLNSAIWLLNR